MRRLEKDRRQELQEQDGNFKTFIHYSVHPLIKTHLHNL